MPKNPVTPFKHTSPICERTTVHSMKYWVYMLRCCDGSFYTGVTNNLTMRLKEHVTGFKEGCYTYKRLPVELVYEKSFTYITNAIAWEKKIKGWNRKKKIALIEGDQKALEYESRGQQRRYIDDMRAYFCCRLRVILRRAQDDKLDILNV